jgi:hypothetical protein
MCLRAGRRDEALRASIGECLALTAQGHFEECAKILAALDVELHGLRSAEVLAPRGLARLMYLYALRAPRRKLLRALGECEKNIECAEMSMRLDIRKAVFRAYARMGRQDDAMRAYDSLASDLRDIVANLEDKDLSNSFLSKIGFNSIVAERHLLERRSARAVSVSTGTSRQA